MSEQLHAIPEAAALMHISVSLLHHLTASRAVGFVRLGRRVYLSADDITAYIASRRVEPAKKGRAA